MVRRRIENADLSKWSGEGHTMRFIQPGLSILAVVMLLISLYRFVEGFQNWQEARQIKQRSRLSYIKPGEVVYKVVPSPDANKALSNLPLVRA